MSSTSAFTLAQPTLRKKEKVVIPSFLFPLFLCTILPLSYLLLMGTESFLTQEIVECKKRTSALEETQQKLRFELIRYQSSSRIEKFAFQAGMVLPEKTEFLEIPGIQSQATLPHQRKKEERGFAAFVRKLLQPFFG